MKFPASIIASLFFLLLSQAAVQAQEYATTGDSTASSDGVDIDGINAFVDGGSGVSQFTIQFDGVEDDDVICSSSTGGGLYVHIHGLQLTDPANLKYELTSPDGSVTLTIADGQCANQDGFDILFHGNPTSVCAASFFSGPGDLASDPYFCGGETASFTPQVTQPIDPNRCNIEHTPNANPKERPAAVLYNAQDDLTLLDQMELQGDWVLTITSSQAYRVQWELFAQVCKKAVGETDPPTPSPTECTGMCMGDPHFRTWNGEWYDFHGECDLVFFHDANFANGKGLTVQIRTTARGPYSFIEAAAVSIGAAPDGTTPRSTLEVTAYGQYVLDGMAQVVMPNLLGDYLITYSKESDNKKHTFTIDLEGDGIQVIVQVFKDLVSVKMEGATAATFGDSRGLMGEFGSGRWLARNGTLLHNENDFGMEWQVRNDEASLFQAPREPQFPSQCILPDAKLAAKQSSRRLGEATISQEAAEMACDHWGDQKEQCVYDVLAMSDLELADAGAF